MMWQQVMIFGISKLTGPEFGATHLAGTESQILAQLTMKYHFTDTDFFSSIGIGC
jgi:hypothetical protein